MAYCTYILCSILRLHATERKWTIVTTVETELPPIYTYMYHVSLVPDPISVAAHKMWVGSWQDLAPAETAAMKLYLSELVGVANHALQSQSWLIKAQGAAALATVAEKMGECVCVGGGGGGWVGGWVGM